MASDTKLIIPLPEYRHEIALAWISMHEVDAIIEEPNQLIIYKEDGNLESIMDTISDKMSLGKAEMKIVTEPKKNWNSIWESNFEPIEIGNLYVRATFHEATTDKNKTELVISPKMAFGTGHHETTYMMLSEMQNITFDSRTVLDYGCGTGILAVFARMRKCGELTCNDIQVEAVENTREHFEINGYNPELENILQGDLDVLGEESYDIILANINRHVLMNQDQSLYALLNKGGSLLMSGILHTDKSMIIDKYSTAGFVLQSEAQRGEWCRFTFTTA